MEANEYEVSRSHGFGRLRRFDRLCIQFINAFPKAVFADPPHLWSGQKVLTQSPEACARKGVEILKALSFIGVVRNGNYVYGTLMANRAVVKCFANGETTFVYAAVAGPERKQVERLRNEIVWRL